MSFEEVNLQQLSRTVSHALRHQPWTYELEIDEEGWADIKLLLAVLRQEKSEWSNLNEGDLVNMIDSSPRKRHEVHNGKIRALYGHSVSGKLVKELAVPPKDLYHGTSSSAAEIISIEGLKPMNRQYVHLSSSKDIAEQVGQRKTKQPIILEIKSYEGYKAGLKFYKGNHDIWLADYVSPEFIVRSLII
jgi:putative RNA 2'-phosphotransferase